MYEIVKINDECLSQPKYEIRKNGKFYAGNITKKGLGYWREKLGIIKTSKIGRKYNNQKHKCLECLNDFNKNELNSSLEICRYCVYTQDQGEYLRTFFSNY